MKNTKKNILDTSRSLFNKWGYSQVTIRMIALELGMSSGNLNYHYRKREDILEALYFEMVVVFDERLKQLEHQTFSLQKIKDDMLTSMTRMFEYRFFWTDLYNLLMFSEKIRKHFEQAYAARKTAYQMFFSILQKEDLLKVPTWKQEYAFLAERMLDFSNTWLYSSALYEKKKMSPAYIDQQANILLAMLYPYLTDAGQEAFARLIPEYFQ